MSDPRSDSSRAAGRSRMAHPRMAMRARPRPTDGVLAVVKDDNGTVNGRVRDLSTDGVGVYVDGCIPIGTTVIVSLSLPGMGGQVGISGHVARCNRLSHGTHLGILFDTTIPGFATQQDILSEFVARTQSVPPSRPAVKSWDQEHFELGQAAPKRAAPSLSRSRA